MRIYVRVCLFTATTDQIKKAMRDHKASSFSLHTPGLLFFLWFFSPSNYSDDIIQISSWEHSLQHRRQTYGKTFAGSGAMAARQVPPRTGEVLSQPGGQNKGDLGNLLCSLQLWDPRNMLFFVSLFFMDHYLTAAWNSEHLWRAHV